MGKWIFEDIQKLKNECLYDKTKTFKQCLREYNKRVRESIQPEVYVKFMIWQCDIYVDVYSIIVAAENVYPQLEDEQIRGWLDKYKEEHHQFV